MRPELSSSQHQQSLRRPHRVMRILRQQGSFRRRRRCKEDTRNPARGQTPKMADSDRQILQLVVILIAFAAVMSLIFYFTMTIVPRMIVVVGIMLCVWSAIVHVWRRS